jgi:hypothetical protein
VGGIIPESVGGLLRNQQVLACFVARFTLSLGLGLSRRAASVTFGLCVLYWPSWLFFSRNAVQTPTIHLR